MSEDNNVTIGCIIGILISLWLLWLAYKALAERNMVKRTVIALCFAFLAGIPTEGVAAIPVFILIMVIPWTSVLGVATTRKHEINADVRVKKDE